MSSEFKHIVRMMGKDLDGAKKVISSLGEIKGVGYNLANSIVNYLKIDSRMRMGSLNDRQIQQIQECIKDVSRTSIPPYYFNHRKDPTTESNLHLIGSDLDMIIRSEIDSERMVQSWRGIRHSLGLKLRGQRTRTTGRKGRSVGVRKATLVRATPAGAATPPA